MSKTNKNTMDMTHGTLWNKILIFALPLAASSILQQLFNSIDTAVVGRFASSQALAAVGSNSSLIALMINLFIGISLGSNVVIAHYIGQRSEKNIQAAIHTAIVVALVSGIFVMIFGQFIAKPVLSLMGTPDDVIDLAVVYLRIYLLGMPFIMLYDFGSSILRSTGDSRRPLYSLIVAGVINTVLNLVLVIGFQNGAFSGVAIGHCYIQIWSVQALIVYILTHESAPIRLEFRKLAVAPAELKKILVIGVPAGIQGMMFSIANVCIQSAINSFGSDAIAGSAAALNYEYFTYYVINAFNQTTVTFTSQNYGAKKLERCKKAFRLCLVWGMAITGIMSVIFVLFKEFFAGVYTADPQAVDYAVIRMVHVLLLEFLTGTYEISGGAMRGMGYSLVPALLTVVGCCGFRVAWLYTVFKICPTFSMLMNVYPATWVITGTLVMGAYLIIRKRVSDK